MTAVLSASGYRLERVWPDPSEEAREEVIHFWLAESALPNLETARQRAPQLLVVSRDLHGEVAGVSTAAPVFVPLLGFECFYYRTFIGRAHRAQGLRSTDLFWRILRESYALLNERFHHGIDSGVLGLYAEIESASMMRVLKQAVWQDHGMNVVYLGSTQDGRQLRVWYFEDAEVP